MKFVSYCPPSPTADSRFELEKANRTKPMESLYDKSPLVYQDSLSETL
jgi:hypothetical protein